MAARHRRAYTETSQVWTNAKDARASIDSIEDCLMHQSYIELVIQTDDEEELARENGAVWDPDTINTWRVRGYSAVAGCRQLLPARYKQALDAWENKLKHKRTPADWNSSISWT